MLLAYQHTTSVNYQRCQLMVPHFRLQAWQWNWFQGIFLWQQCWTGRSYKP